VREVEGSKNDADYPPHFHHNRVGSSMVVVIQAERISARNQPKYIQRGRSNRPGRVQVPSPALDGTLGYATLGEPILENL